jgi:hypothetical protein
MGGPTPYDKINAPNDIVYPKVGRKLIYFVGLKEEEIEKVREVWNSWTS